MSTIEAGLPTGTSSEPKLSHAAPSPKPQKQREMSPASAVLLALLSPFALAVGLHFLMHRTPRGASETFEDWKPKVPGPPAGVS